ncbi:prolyl aminopeptidase [Entomomonas sp. E2T0]|uniref:prolyl aminopeptidase n=1 Tax=Entomomonas sp. E2T0 TaxID=2930213 RepID=UPI0022282056|nr:prolyl aminopeptidase [Entomomonas sp. E2T0]UYZ84762.1 prolyl aminopeptidase [Entomomonas sp. E2T0]
MQPLFPEIKPYATHKLAVQSPHVLYIEESGSMTGLPVLFLHGGPGGGCDENSARFFDPTIYRIITFDQRGCGRSTPYASLENNTTWDLVADIELIRKELAIDKWVVFGGSWGSTLALAYAQTHPERVLGLILRGIFLCRPTEIEWFYQKGASYLFPDYWEDYIAPIPEVERGDLVQAFYKRLTGTDEIAQLNAARAWSGWEGSTITLAPNPKITQSFLETKKALAMARIECHYFINNAFLEPNQLLRDMDKIAHIPSIIVHGRYDVICPLDNAWQLHKLWPNSELNIIRESGHSAFEVGTVDALVKATHAMAEKLLTEK